MSGLKVLVSGASVAGPTVAFWLLRAGAQVTVVERAPALRTEGQNIDIRGLGVDVVKRMNVEEEIRRQRTREEGIRFIDDKARVVGEFPATDDTSFTAEIEIMRGDLSRIFYNATKDRADYLFDTQITSIEESPKGVRVKFNNDEASTRDFDILIAADGQSSRTRALAFNFSKEKYIKSLDQWLAWWNIPRIESDDDWARWYNTPGGRVIFLRPDNSFRPNLMRVAATLTGNDDKMRPFAQSDVPEQKAAWRKAYQNGGWQTDRIFSHIDEANDFHMQEIIQVKMPTWHTRRVALVGDAAYAPSPITGVGTSLAIAGAYILAGELSQNPQDPEAAFAAYEQKMRPLVEKGQKIVPGAPHIVNPQTTWGIRVLSICTWVLSLGFLQRILKLVGFLAPAGKGTQLPDYQF